MRRPLLPLGLALLLITSAVPGPAAAQVAVVPSTASVSYLNPGRYVIFQGTYVNDQGNMESGLVKFDSQTGLAWLLRPAPKTAESPAGFLWVPVKN